MADTPVGKLVVILGPTASGKTAVAIKLAQIFDGEIICADSRTVYRGMDIGTAKPLAAERQGVPHHLLDIVDPDQPFSVADFKRLAGEAIADIASRGKLPILVGGSGLYIDAVVYDYQFRPVNAQLRQQFADATVDELQAELRARDIPLPENDQNTRYLLRSLEAGKGSDQHTKLRDNTLVIGIQVEPDELRSRIEQRVSAMVEAGLVEEVARLADHYGWDIPPMRAPAYKSFRGYIEGHETLDQARAKFIQLDSQLAKKQRIWFKRNNSIHNVSDPNKIVDIVTTFLNKLH